MAALEEIKSETVLKISPEKCAKTVLYSWAQAPCVILERAGQIIGFAGLRTFIPAHTDDPALTEYMFYIEPESRSMKAARALSDAVKAVSDKFKIPLMFTHYLNGSTVENKEKFLRRWGYKPYAVQCYYGGLE